MRVLLVQSSAESSRNECGVASHSDIFKVHSPLCLSKYIALFAYENRHSVFVQGKALVCVSCGVVTPCLSRAPCSVQRLWQSGGVVINLVSPGAHLGVVKIGQSVGASLSLLQVHRDVVDDERA